MKEYHRSSNGNARQFQNSTSFFNETTSLSSLISLFFYRNTVLYGRKLRYFQSESRGTRCGGRHFSIDEKAFSGDIVAIVKSDVDNVLKKKLILI
jgi:hypothetical protein